MTDDTLDVTDTFHAPCLLRDVKRGDFVRRKAGAATVYTRGDYDKSRKRYSLGDYSDVGREVFLKGDTIVYIGFSY